MDPVTLGMAKADAKRNYAKTGNTVDVRDYVQSGEVWDGTKTTDVSPILQRAVDAAATLAATRGPVKVYVPNGKYKISTQINWKTKVGLRGESQENTLFYPQLRNCFIRGDDLSGAVLYSDCIFERFTVDGSDQDRSNYSSAIKGIFIQNMLRPRFLNMTIQFTTATGFGVDFLDDAMFQNCLARGCGAGATARLDTGAGFGIATGLKKTESCTFMNCTSVDNYTHGFFTEQNGRGSAIHKPYGLKLVGCYASGNWDGFLDAGSTGAIISACHFVDNLYAGMSIYSNAAHPGNAGRDGIVTGCVIAGNGSEANGGGGVVYANVDGGIGAGGYDIQNNLIDRNGGPGVWITPTSVVGTGFKIRSNTIKRNNGSGILIASTSAVSKLKIVDNDMEENGQSSASAYRDGITILSPTNGLVVRNNRAYNLSTSSQSRGVALRGSATSVLPQIDNNDLRGNGTTSLFNEHTVADATKITANLTDSGTTQYTNMVINPSVETAITGWSATNGTVTRVNTDAKSGSYSATITAGSSSSARITVAGVSVTEGQVWTGSIWAKVTAGRSIRARMNFSDSTNVSTTAITATGDWQRVSITATIPAGVTTAGIAIERLSGTAGAAAGDTIFADAAMMTLGGDLIAYFDGDSANSVWNGTPHASSSTYTPA